ncbi:MAG TPA: sugar ABC transporter ATP-binding protein [Chloroflexi bacterium]|nr:sugar ABC transporter ATP-binding protein [Chloroflexota bacterium]
MHADLLGAERSVVVSTPAALSVTGVSKRFGATVALESASFACERSEVHGLVGENGAGKSTLVKILSGLVANDSGTLQVGGRQVRLWSARDAGKAGIATAFQELSLIPHFTVAQNLLLGHEPVGRLGLVSGRRLLIRAQQVLDYWEADRLPVDSTVADLSLADRQRLEIVKALRKEPQILLLDEPTSALGPRDVEWMNRQVWRLTKLGSAVVFVSHRLGEVRGFCNRVTVLRNGRDVGTLEADQASDEQIMRLMLGKEVSAQYRTKAAAISSSDEPVVEVEGLGGGRELRSATLTIGRGEIVGVAGLQGHGQRQLFMTLFGAARRDRGSIRVGGRPVQFRHPVNAVRSRIGISLVPEDRKHEGLFLEMSVRDNMSLPSLSRYSHLGLITERSERSAVLGILQQLNVDPRKIDDSVSSLSGGNQQKIVIGKWLMNGSQVMLLYDPTRGVDVGSKAEIFQLIRMFASKGGSALFYSSDIEELVHLCSRVVIMYRGSTVRELHGEEVSREAILSAMVGAEDS